MSGFAHWVPKLLSEYEVGRAVSAIEEIARRDKPIAEVGCLDGVRADLEADLKACLDVVRGSEHVQFWVKPTGKQLRFGFYSESWALNALEFLDRVKLTSVDRAWIGGLLFGYHPRAIQAFITRETSRKRPRAISAR